MKTSESELSYKLAKNNALPINSVVLHKDSKENVGKAIVIGSRPEYHDHSGIFIINYRVCTVTKNGEWLKLWKEISPGDIQRGYLLQYRSENGHDHTDAVFAR